VTSDDLPESEPPAIDVSGVEQSYGDEPVLEGLDATVARGELVGLVGPNGAGKTTLLRTISGALAPDAGTVRVAGQGSDRGLDDVAALSSAAASRRIAVVPQTTRLSFAFSVRELVAMGRHPHRSRFQPPTREDRDLVEAAMERTRTAEFADRSVEAVSGGERQRVLLARAIAQDAPVLLLDEPTANLDLNHAVETMSLVRELIDEDGTAALAAIHDLELAARFCDRLLVLADGEIVANGPPAAVLDAEGLGAAFDARVAVERSPIDGGVTIRAMDDPDLDARVHVVGGGEPAAAALGRLGEAGADCSLGPVPEGDRAVSTAAAFDAEIVTTTPFSAVGSSTLERARDLAAAADATVLAADGVAPDGAGWLECCDAAEDLVVVEDAAAEGDAVDAVADVDAEDAALLLDRAPTTDLDSLPGAVAAVVARDAAADRETRHRDSSAVATMADGGRDGDSEYSLDGDSK
jgi:iron complex transport system ATP-binding protein